MRALRTTTIIGLLLLRAYAPAWAAVNIWSPLGPEGGVLQGVAIDPSTPSTVFAAGLSGAFRSTDGGANWQRVFHLECAHVAVHPTDGSIVFVVNRSREVYKSTDGGLTFALSNTGIPALLQGTVFGRLAFQPGNPDVMYYAWPSGLFKSIDGGANWAASDAGAVNLQSVCDLAVDSANPEVVYLILASKGVYKSIDGGATWNSANTGLPFTLANVRITGFAQDPSHPQTLYVISKQDQRTYVSTTGGTSWALLNSGAQGSMTSLLVAPGDGLTIYAGGAHLDGAGPYQRRLFKSTDGGVTFVSASDSGFSTPAPMAIPAASPLTVYASLGDGLSKTTNGAVSWVPINTNLRSDEHAYQIAFSPSSPSTWYAAFWRSGIRKTTDGGATLSTVTTNLIDAGIGTIVVDPTNPEIVLAGGSTLESFDIEKAYDLVRSTDGGASWNPVNNPGLPIDEPTFLQPWGFVAIATNPTTYYVAAVTSGIYKSTDGGLNFVRTSTGLPSGQPTQVFFQAICAADTTGTTLYAATTHGLYKTINGATSWTASGAGLPSLNVRHIAVSLALPQRVFVISEKIVYRSTDSGASWNPIATAFPGTPEFLTMDPNSPATVYIGGSITAGARRNSWISRTIDGGDRWNPVTVKGLDLIALSSLAVDPANSNHLIAGGRGGLVEITLSPEPSRRRAARR